MFKEFGQIMGMLKNPSKIKEELEQFQQKVGQITAEGTAGGGMVSVKMNGHCEIVSCKISDETMQMNDREMLEDLFRAATNQALQKIQQSIAEERTKMATGLGIPAGMDLPGLS
ncbi:MAG: YbaB/EbfC family nucleoid-associated protein [Gemmataceae bacterium]